MIKAQYVELQDAYKWCDADQQLRFLKYDFSSGTFVCVICFLYEQENLPNGVR
jgi:hypothetical protein